jgi:hypothetical protein
MLGKNVDIKALLPLLIIPWPVVAQPAEDSAQRWLLEIAAGRGALSAAAVDMETDSAFIGPAPVAPPSVLSSTYDDDDALFRLSMAYEIVPRFAVEIAYSDLGEYSPRFGFFSGPNDQLELLLAMLEGKQLTLGARFDHALTQRFSGIWKVGVSRSSFDVTTVRTPATGSAFRINPLVINSLEHPPDETGVMLGIGIRWQGAGRIGIGGSYHRHDMEIGTIETVDVSIIVTL